MVTNLASSPEYFFKSCRSRGVLTVLKMSLRYESVVQVVYYTRNQTVDDKSTEERKKRTRSLLSSVSKHQRMDTFKL